MEIKIWAAPDHTTHLQRLSQQDGLMVFRQCVALFDAQAANRPGARFHNDKRVRVALVSFRSTTGCPSGFASTARRARQSRFWLSLGAAISVTPTRVPAPISTPSAR